LLFLSAGIGSRSVVLEYAVINKKCGVFSPTNWLASIFITLEFDVPITMKLHIVFEQEFYFHTSHSLHIREQLIPASTP